MKPKTLILMILAISCGLGASFMTSRLLAERGGEQQQETVAVLVARKPLEVGFLIKNPEELFEAKPYIKGEEPKEAITDPAKLKGGQLKKSLRPGDFITLSDLYGDGQGLLIIPKGYRAVGIRVNMESIAGGFAALPHSYVDIVSTIRRGDDKSSFSQVLLENVLVLAADTNSVRNEQGQAMPANVVTVALTPEQSLKVTMAKELGPLSLALRSFGDKQKVDVAKVTVEDLMTKKNRDNVSPVDTQPAFTEPVAPVIVKAEPKVNKGPDYGNHPLVVIEGDKQRVVTFQYNKDTGNVVLHGIDRTPLNPEVQAPPPLPTLPLQPKAPARPEEGNGETGGF